MQQLPDTTVRLIGSSQVITSVFSVVKELFENAIDAKATSVEIKLDNYGLDKIEVRDNGCGVKAVDISVLAKRHYTSKIRSHNDLEALTTYGFRGEALASLCAVAEVVVTTKTIKDDVSFAYTISSQGDITSTAPSHLGQGTTICAKNLFKNLPVRKQYHNIAKKKKEELKRVEDLLMAYGVVRPDVRISFRHSKELLWEKFVLPDVTSALRSILGKPVMGQMEWKTEKQEDPHMEIKMCLPKPGSDVALMSRSSPDRSFLFVNSRPVQLKDIDKLIRQYYSNCHACDITRHPLYYISITLPPSDVDVNLEPNKTTVMMTSMNVLRERLEEMLLYVYGPLDQAPSWRYRDADKENTAKLTDKATSLAHASREKHGAGETVAHNNFRVAVEKNVSGGHGMHTPCLLESMQLGSSSTTVWKHGEKGDSNCASIQTCTEKPVHDVENLPENKSGYARSDAFQKSTRRTPQFKQTANITNQAADEFVASGPVDLANEAADLAKTVVDDLMCTFSSAASSSREVSGLTAALGSKPDSLVFDSEGRERSDCQLVNSKAVQVLHTEANEKPAVSVEKIHANQQDTGSMLAGSCSRNPELSNWSLGTCIISENDGLVQPVKLLAPSSSHIPGKRPVSPLHDQQVQKSLAPPEKRRVPASTGRRLCPAQSTLYDMINNVAVKRPLSAKDYFFKEKRPEVVQRNPELGFEEVTEMLIKMWENLDKDERNVFFEKCSQDTERYSKEVAEAKTAISTVKTNCKSKALSVRDMVAASSTQSSPEVQLMSKSTHQALAFSMARLKNCMSEPLSRSFPSCQVLAQLPSCKAWICQRGKELCILNCYRLSESILFHHLISKHHLPKHHCQTLRLHPGNCGQAWSALEKIAGNTTTDGPYFHVIDVRITANGFDIKCWKDADDKLCGELVGLCGDVPTYGLPDLLEVLAIITQNNKCSLAQARPLKVVNHLKAEAVRMARQQMPEKCLEDVQELLEQAERLIPPTHHVCLHGRPFYHSLVLDLETASVCSEESGELNALHDSSMGSHTTQPSCSHTTSCRSSQLVDTDLCLEDMMDFG